jgi:hypothetical protein
MANRTLLFAFVFLGMAALASAQTETTPVTLDLDICITNTQFIAQKLFIASIELASVFYIQDGFADLMDILGILN